MGENNEGISTSKGKIIPASRLANKIKEQNQKEAEELFRKMAKAAAEKSFTVIKGGTSKS